ncbi:MAG: ATP-binding protein [Vicinamibacterales bacterium]
MQDFEKLGLFYLGREYDLETKTLGQQPVLYDSRDLVTHGVCVGMTGSGKTGLCLSVIEEAAIDGVPVIAIDPKGDLGNLLLTFPTLAPEDFRPWVDEDEARRNGMSPDAFAAKEAGRWRDGLAAWGEDGARIARLRSSADFTIYTPGSKAGVPISIMSSFAAPRGSARDDAEALSERAGSTALSVLSLAGVEVQARSREHTLLSTILAVAWRAGQDLDLAAVIQQVQTPPFQKVGIVDLESFFPSKDRFELAMQLNGLLAAPGFEQWLEGEPLDPASLLYTPAGKPRVAIFSIAHLGDAERMFFVALLLNQLVAWMRAQSGTSSLRAIIYMDEIAGYFPPVANPPSKGPLLTLLKQGRAFGVGVLLATQNPVDLDYKGLANIGTWFLGRLQTERDKARMLDGLEGAAAGSLDRATADRMLSALDKRVFLLHDVHASGPVVFQTRWTLSYLRGPISRDQIKLLTGDRRPVSAAAAASPVAGVAAATVTAAARGAASTERPIVPPGIEQFFVPPPKAAGAIVYAPVILGSARVGFTDAKNGIDESRDVLYAVEISDGAVPVDWTAAAPLAIQASALVRAPGAPAAQAPVPSAALQVKNYANWEKAFSRWLGQSETLEIFRHRDSKTASRAGESERDFRIRLQEASRAARDEAVDAIRKKYAPKQAALAERLRRAEASVEREQQQASQAKLQTAISFGTTLLGAFLGRKAVNLGTVGRATTAVRGVGRSMKESEDIKRAGESVEAVKAQAAELEAEVLAETQRLTSRFEAESPLEKVALAPKRGQVTVQFVALGWVPVEEGAART